MDLETPPQRADASRITKRKLDDTIELLNISVVDHIDGPRPPKRTNTSVYSAFATCGSSVVRMRPPATNSTPALTSFLAKTRHGQRDKLRINFDTSVAVHIASYRPGSTPDFLNRLQTYKLSTYSARLAQVDSVRASRCGWINDGKERLRCITCGVSWILATQQGMTSETAQNLAIKQGQMLVNMHKDTCPWRKRQCDPSIYRLPLKTRTAMTHDIKSRAQDLNPLMLSISVKHPLTRDQVRSILSRLSPETQISSASTQLGPSEPAIITSVFGWQVMISPSASAHHERLGFPSLARRGSESTLDPFSQGKDYADAILTCSLCQRRVGIWTFSDSESIVANTRGSSASDQLAVPSPAVHGVPARHFDVLKEHRSHCPYVVRSTYLSTFSLSTAGREKALSSSSPNQRRMPPTAPDKQISPHLAVEGWRAVVSILCRPHRRPSLSSWASGTPEPPKDAMEELIEDVKTHGGRDLLAYVKRLLR